MQRILVAHDGSKASDKALRKALEIALSMNASLTVLAVVPELYLTELSDADRQRITEVLKRETEENMERIRKALSGKPIEIKFLVREGDPAEKILETAHKMKVDLIVTGSHGKHGTKKFLIGSVSSKVVEYSKFPVLVVK
ncbi:MAG TPA: universal stress protein [Thermodesulfovibrio thiophilus]|uniref:universal stress protein n=1 Tax=Thermodesulfovibrio thiophilus TaxID=340095 RepID=UPI000416ECAB|nr:universal stress protein [Thermodesulfovibrio thiophilus]HHW20012.1 universal stress protein [Thermodesulfovibrio thiophilus]HOA83290.1 universal stress protein [Thermodesulfovibrio thiophilus]HQA03672.1 universal stress protein [Thermodesulfovibrio thiophilus]HQD36507.1 universal stress protein [Thermodesulfovibrio thiophilus]